MADVIVAVIIAMILAVVVGVAVAVTYKPQEKVSDKGTWSIAETTTAKGTVIMICKNNHRRTEYIKVASIPDDAEDWTARYEEGMAVARERLASLKAKK